MNTPVIVYQNPLGQWFWDGGWVYLLCVIVVGIFFLAALLTLDDLRSKRARKKRWIAMNEMQRNSWRHGSPRNNAEHKEWSR